MFLRFPRKLYSTFRLGIRREGKSRWERRTPIVPDDVNFLLSRHPDLVIAVQPCNKRCFPDEAYSQAGASIEENLGNCNLILGVKEVPIDEIHPNTCYLYFSHTHKGQIHNLPILKKFLSIKSSLFDLELLTNNEGRRKVQFGYFAGIAGIINSLHGLGDRLLEKGFSNPFASIPMAQYFDTVDVAKHFFKEVVGKKIIQEGIPEKFCPLIICVSGSGQVSNGVLSMLTLLPHEFVSTHQLETLVTKPDRSARNKIFICKMTPKDYVSHKEGLPFDKAHYYLHPSEYENHFPSQILPWISMFVNGIYWDQKYPRFITQKNLDAYASSGKLRLLSICDISCDIKGSIEVMHKATTIDEPFFDVQVSSGDPIQVMSIDNLPCQFAKDASLFFSNILKDAINDFVQGHPDDHLPGGEFSSKFSMLKSLVDSNIQTPASHSKRKILLLGNGLVSMPIIEYFERRAKDNAIAMTVVGVSPRLSQEASASASQADGGNGAKFSLSYLQCDLLDPNKKEEMERLISSHDIIISAVPASMHWRVAEMAIRTRRPMVTSSYFCDKMKELEGRINETGIVVLGEMGLDPGLDHLTAATIIEDLGPQNITSFQSWCGGLPAPECVDNPLKYKFSWSPKGSLLAPLNYCRYLLNGKVFEAEQGGKSLDAPFSFSSIKSDDTTVITPALFPGFNLEGLPNRDSLQYIPIYGLDLEDKKLKTFIRGTLRYAGFSQILTELRTLGLLSNTLIGNEDQFGTIRNWSDAMKLRQVKTDSIQEPAVLLALQWLGIFSQFEEFNGTKYQYWIDSLSDLMIRKLSYQEGERDLVLLEHRVEAVDPNSIDYLERRTSSLVVYGEPLQLKGASPWKLPKSAMSKCVGYPLAIAAELILDGVNMKNGHKACGMVNPLDLDRSFKSQLLDQLAPLGIQVKEKREKVLNKE